MKYKYFVVSAYTHGVEFNPRMHYVIEPTVTYVNTKLTLDHEITINDIKSYEQSLIEYGKYLVIFYNLLSVSAVKD